MNSYNIVAQGLINGTVVQDDDAFKEHVKKMTWQERLKIANYLNQVFYNFDENDDLRLDKTIFSARKLEDL